MRQAASILLLAALAAPAAAATHLQMEQVSPSVYVVRPAEGDNVAVSNAAFIVLPDRVLVYDTLSSPTLMAEMLGLIGKVAKVPVSMVAISHWHKDHAGGLELFARRPHTLYAARGTVPRINETRKMDLAFLEKRERDLVALARRAVDSEEADRLALQLRDVRGKLRRRQQLPPVELDIEVSTVMEIALGGQIVYLQTPGLGHTAGDLIVYVVNDKVLLAGDLLSVGTLPNLSDAYTAAWLRRLDEIGHMNIDHIVPGHGPVGTKDDVQALRRYLETIRSMVAPIAENGTTNDLVEKLRLPAPFDTWTVPELWFPATYRVFNELRGLVPPPPDR